MSALNTQVGGMNQDEIIAMAREAGFRTGHIDLTTGEPIPFIAPASGTSCMWEVLRFAALVAAKERESIAAHYAAQPHVEFFGAELAEEIRARGTKEGA